MHAAKFEETVDTIIQKDSRYHREAYIFVRDALGHTVEMVAKKPNEKPPHVSGQQLLKGIRTYALEQFGPMAQTVFNEWGIQACEDFGEIVFNMVESNLLAKTTEDSREDFRSGYDFFEAFRRPFLPPKEVTAAEPEPKQV